MLRILDLFFPKFCIACNAFGKYVCDKCLAILVPNTIFQCLYCYKPSTNGATCIKCQTRYTLDGYCALYIYKKPLSSIIKVIKYQLVSELLKELLNKKTIQPWVHYIQDNTMQYNAQSYMVPIPLHTKRLALRGFNQSEYIACSINNLLDVPTRAATERIRNTKPLATISTRAARAEEIHDAFIVKSAQVDFVKGAIIYLVDDVITSGATVKEVARVLKKAGAQAVFALSIAKD
jgi:competence protein ComFC